MSIYDDRKIYNQELARAIRQERKNNERFAQIMQDLCEIAPRMWRYGDGEGGFVLYEILEALNRAGCGLTRQRVVTVFAQTGIVEKEKIKVYTKKTISHKTKLKVLAGDKYQCKHCGTNENLTVDHIIPESKGGSSELDNLQTLCASCNSKKGVKLP